MQKTRLSEQVKALTWSAHQALEKYLVKIIRQISSVEDYRRLLLLFYGYYKPVENLIEPHLKNSSPVPLQIRKSERLLSDIQEIDLREDIIPVATELPLVQNDAQALAALYVLEGSTLGGKYILQMVRKNIDLPEGTADSFLSGHGINTALNWKCFKDFLDEEIIRTEEHIFLETVNDTFDRFYDWAQINYQYVEQEKL
jgi:heme oxygenase (biliverdin-IX-beta and delta-forming)